ncbi:MAG: hypothetical protein OXS28_20900 [Gammaproteobacteria bacterium]|nr:hypothetical protein [Gammaproteobacteria bacterium]MDE0285592.1 hypothetical protein [Gammaproteobacteria bacterium]
MKVNRNIVHKSSLVGHQDDNYMDASVQERIGMVWPLTKEIASLNPKHDVERRLQRHIAVLIRPGR